MLPGRRPRSRSGTVMADLALSRQKLRRGRPKRLKPISVEDPRPRHVLALGATVSTGRRAGRYRRLRRQQAQRSRRGPLAGQGAVVRHPPDTGERVAGCTETLPRRSGRSAAQSTISTTRLDSRNHRRDREQSRQRMDPAARRPVGPEPGRGPAATLACPVPTAAKFAAAPIATPA